MTTARAGAEPWEDTTATDPRAQIYRTWLRYLATTHGHYHIASFRPSPYWLPSEQQRWRVYSMAFSYLPDGAVPDVLSVEPDSEHADQYRLLIRFTSPDDDNALRSRLVWVTLFAVRSGDDWLLANALPHLTRTWRRDTVGVLTYVIQPGHTFDRNRAEQAVSFVDSLASALSIPPPDRITYYITSGTDEVYHIIGIDTDKKGMAPGGLAQPTNYNLFSGIPALGENYRHELTHIVILPLMGCATYFISEGVPTWLGGTSGMGFPAAARGLAEFLRDHPDVTLDTIMTARYPTPQTHARLFYPAGAVFVKMAFDHGGTSALKKLFECAPRTQDFQSSMEHVLGESWPAIVDEWRRAALSFAPDSSEHP